MTVSYTHLDVYKRQHEKMPVSFLNFKQGNSMTWLRIVCTPVSYTHLDVYKRQVQRQDLRLLDDTKIRQREIAGNTENLAGTMVLECMKQGFDEIHMRVPLDD